MHLYYARRSVPTRCRCLLCDRPTSSRLLSSRRCLNTPGLAFLPPLAHRVPSAHASSRAPTGVVFLPTWCAVFLSASCRTDQCHAVFANASRASLARKMRVGTQYMPLRAASQIHGVRGAASSAFLTRTSHGPLPLRSVDSALYQPRYALSLGLKVKGSLGGIQRCPCTRSAGTCTAYV